MNTKLNTRTNGKNNGIVEKESTECESEKELDNEKQVANICTSVLFGTI